MSRKLFCLVARHPYRTLVATSAFALAVFLPLNQQAGAYGGFGGYTDPSATRR